MELLLPDVDWRSHKWTSAGQIAKIGEEVFEVAEALATGDLVNAIRETLDTIQTGYTMLDILQNEWQKEYDSPCPIGRFVSEHKAKLERKGYLKTEEPFVPSKHGDSVY